MVAPRVRFLVSWLLLGVWACGPGEPAVSEGPGSESVAPAGPDVVEWAPEPAAPLPPEVEADLPPEESSPIALEPAPGAHVVAPLERPEVFEEAPPSDPTLSLDDLLRLPTAKPPPEAPASVEWAGDRRGASDAPRQGKPGLRVDYSQENVTEGIPMQSERKRTDVGVSVPVDPEKRLRVKGGVRVDERAISDTEREADTTPTVGVEVEF